MIYVWARPEYGGFGDRYAALSGTAAARYRQANNKIAWDGIRTGGTPVRIRTFCAQVLKYEVTTRDHVQLISQVHQQLRPAWWTKLAIFADFNSPNNAGGFAYPFPYDDERAGPDNLNNIPNQYTPTLNAVIYSPGWSNNTVTHEVMHTLGAVQRYAPGANFDWHCNDGIDLMCYQQGSEPYSEVYCQPADAGNFWQTFSFQYVTGGSLQPPADCTKWIPTRPWSNGEGGDYFYAGNPTGYLSNHWNVARAYNGFISRDNGTP